MIHISMKMMTLYKIIRSMPCFFKEVTHFYCPACGGTRSVIALLHLDIERAFLCNPTVVYTGVMFLWCIAGWMVKKLTAREMKSMKPRLWMLILGAEQKGELMNYLGNLEKHPQGEAITTAAKDIRSFFHLRVLEVTVLVIF